MNYFLDRNILLENSDCWALSASANGTKNGSFSWRPYLINVTKSARNCEFGRIDWRNNGKLLFSWTVRKEYPHLILTIHDGLRRCFIHHIFNTSLNFSPAWLFLKIEPCWRVHAMKYNKLHCGIVFINVKFAFGHQTLAITLSKILLSSRAKSKDVQVMSEFKYLRFSFFKKLLIENWIIIVYIVSVFYDKWYLFDFFLRVIF